MGMFSIWGSPFPYGDYRTEMGRETRIFPYGESPFPNRVCFHLGINIYNNCTGDFPYMSLNGNVCFFVMYHYETNAILITPITGLDSEQILEAYKKNFEYLVSKGFKPKIYVMDNQATKQPSNQATKQPSQSRRISPCSR
jgi:beta-glucosidase/6-phospho-beta-glucosidase/beta-galactosidase